MPKTFGAAKTPAVTVPKNSGPLRGRAAEQANLKPPMSVSCGMCQFTFTGQPTAAKRVIKSHREQCRRVD